MIAKLSKQSKLSKHARGSWSARIEQRYRCRLSEDLADWFDSEIWKSEGRNEYHLPVDPEILLQEAPDVIWPGLMPCDQLPLISNDAGDWLCVRLDSSNTASEIVQWYHGGGDWIPWGKSICEAIIFDAIRDRLPGPQRPHATPAQSPRNAAGTTPDDPIYRWACRHLPKQISALGKSTRSGEEIAAALLDSETSEAATRCILVEAALSEPLSGVLTPQTAETLDLHWCQAIEWVFDLERMSTQQRTRLSNHFELSLDVVQDWDAAAAHCLRVTQVAPELAWAWDLLGYANERRGAADQAQLAYIRGARCSVFTDQSVRLRTHWTSNQSSKFSAARLLQVAPELVHESAYLRTLCEGVPEERRVRATEQWLAKADAATVLGDVAAAHKNLVQAGWDLGAEPMPIYADILERIAETAVQADCAAQAELAETHRACLAARYGL